MENNEKKTIGHIDLLAKINKLYRENGTRIYKYAFNKDGQQVLTLMIGTALECIFPP